VLEPAAFATPVICGPHMENFAEIAAEFDAAGALARLDRSNLGRAISSLLNDPDRLSRLGAASLSLAEAKRGATARCIQTLSAAYDAALPRPVPPVVLIPLTWLWRAGMALDRGVKRLRSCRPEARVISVGNLAVGGTGKTPMVLWLCDRLARAGVKVGVLTRGYGRHGGAEVEVFDAAAAADISVVGEEAALILRQGKAQVGAGPDRCKTWHIMRGRGAPEVIVLDDGFQHWRMKRDADIVLIDALDPFRGGVLPLGRLREPFSALNRATAIVITRTRDGREYAGLIAGIRKYSHTAPIFRARVIATRPDIGDGPVGAFCGLGQPAGFEQTLKQIGIAPEFIEVFPDHHRYTDAEIAALRARTAILVTTEKDLMNVPAALRDSIHAVPITLELDDPDGFLAVVARL
jgi:tetraacyldisaccharide 4'-kinase